MQHDPSPPSQAQSVPGAQRPAPSAAAWEDWIGDFLLACDAAQAAGRATALRDPRSAAVAIGAFAFLLSDMTIALYRFGHVSWPVDQATLPTYYLAQGLIAFFVLPRKPSNV